MDLNLHFSIIMDMITMSFLIATMGSFGKTAVPRFIPCFSSFATSPLWWCIAFVTRCGDGSGSGWLWRCGILISEKHGYWWLWPVYIAHFFFGSVWTMIKKYIELHKAYVWNLGPAKSTRMFQNSISTSGKHPDTIWSLRRTSIVAAFVSISCCVGSQSSAGYRCYLLAPSSSLTW